MPKDSKIASNRKHKRSPSPDDASKNEELSKRRKHRHHHHRSRKHRHHSKKEKLPKIDIIEDIEDKSEGNRNSGDEVEKIDQNSKGNRNSGDELEKIDPNSKGNRNSGDEVEKIDQISKAKRTSGDEVEKIDQISKAKRTLGDKVEKIDQNSKGKQNLGEEVENIEEVDCNCVMKRDLGEEVEKIEEFDGNCEVKRNLIEEVENIEEIDQNSKDKQSFREEVEKKDQNREGKRSSGEEMGNLGVVKVVTGVNNLGIDYDMEEGEIIEEEDGEIIGDMEALQLVVESYCDNLDTGSLDRGVDNNRKDSDEEEDKYGRKQCNKYNGKIGDEATKRSMSARLAHHVSGENSSSFMESGKANADYDLERDLSIKDVQGHKKSATRSPSYYKHHTRSSSRSPSQSRGRSRSQSVLRESSLRGTSHRQGDKFYERLNGRDSDDEGHHLDNKHCRGSREMLREKERERSSRRSDRHHTRDSSERDKIGSPDIDRERIKVKEMINREREKARGKEGQRERHKDKEMEREKYRQRDKEFERERDRQWERERGRQREIDKERDRRQRDRERSRGRSRDIHLDRDSDRDTRLPKYEDDERDKYNQSRHRRYDESDHQNKLNKSDREITSPPEKDNEKLNRFEDEQDDYEERIVLKLAEQEDDDLDRIKEESRRRKLAILEKYKSQQPRQQETVHEEQVQLTAEDPKEQPSQSVTAQNIVSVMPDAQTEAPDIFTTEPSFGIGKSPPQNGLPVLERESRTGGLGEGTPKSERSPDMFCDDIFGESPAGIRKTGKGDGKAIERSGLNDNWDDAEGYYSYRFGELLDGRYEIIAAHGKGVFSTVVRAKDLKAKPGDPEEVAIKMIRSNETMYKAGMEELIILKKLVDADPEDRRHCVRFISSFKYRNHLCLVFESLHMNLREVLKKFGRNIGLKLTAVRAYAKQLFIALKHLRNCGVLHCDIKPDNMLVNEAKNVLKLCDFGNAMFAGKNEITPYLVSRFYRAPEIILGLPYDHPLDMWSVGCCLFELYSGKVLFPGATNNDMLRLHMELKGHFPKKMLRKGAFIDQHFDHDLNFLASEEDPVTKKAIKRLMLNIKPKDVASLIFGSPGEDPKMLANFKDLMEKIFLLDPDKRLTVSQALSHPFITGK